MNKFIPETEAFDEDEPQTPSLLRRWTARFGNTLKTLGKSIINDFTPDKDSFKLSRWDFLVIPLAYEMIKASFKLLWAGIKLVGKLSTGVLTTAVGLVGALALGIGEWGIKGGIEDARNPELSNVQRFLGGLKAAVCIAGLIVGGIFAAPAVVPIASTVGSVLAANSAVLTGGGIAAAALTGTGIISTAYQFKKGLLGSKEAENSMTNSSDPQANLNESNDDIRSEANKLRSQLRERYRKYNRSVENPSHSSFLPSHNREERGRRASEQKPMLDNDNEKPKRDPSPTSSNRRIKRN